MGDNFQCGMCVFLLKEIENLKKELYQHSIQPSCLDQLVEKFSDSCPVLKLLIVSAVQKYLVKQKQTLVLV